MKASVINASLNPKPKRFFDIWEGRKMKVILVILSALIVFFVSLAMTLHKKHINPIWYEIASWALATALFLCFEAILHYKN